MPAATRALTEGEQKQVDGVAENLLSGKGFRMVAQSARSIIGYQPPLGFDRQVKMLRILAAGAAVDERQATLISQILRQHPSAALTPGDAVAKLYDAAAEVIDGEFFDLMRAASPEPGRPSEHRQDYILADALRLSYVLSHAKAAMLPGDGPGVGWCEAILLDQERVDTIILDARIARAL